MPAANPYNLVVLTQFPYSGHWERESNDIQCWATAFKGDHLNVYRLFDFFRRLNKYQILLMELIEPRFDLALKIKKRFPQKKLLGVIEGSLAKFDQKYSPAEKVKAVEIFRQADAIGVLIKESVPFFQQFTDKPVFYLGVPYPVAWTYQHILDPVHKEKLIEINISTFNPPGGASQIFTFQAIQRSYPQVQPLLFSQQAAADTAKAAKAGLHYFFKKISEWQSYFVEHAKSYIGLNMDYRYTWGRFPIDCAAAGIPCVGTANSQTHKILFPQLIVQPFEVAKAQELCLKLLNSPAFYAECRAYALDQIKQFDLEPSKQRLLDFMQKQQWI